MEISYTLCTREEKNYTMQTQFINIIFVLYLCCIFLPIAQQKYWTAYLCINFIWLFNIFTIDINITRVALHLLLKYWFICCIRWKGMAGFLGDLRVLGIKGSIGCFQSSLFMSSGFLRLSKRENCVRWGFENSLSALEHEIYLLMMS